MDRQPEFEPADLETLKDELAAINASAAQTDAEIEVLCREIDETIEQGLIVQGKLSVISMLLRTGEL